MEKDEKYFARDFKEILTELRGGMCLQELTDDINRVTKAAIETGKAGSVTLKLNIKPQGTGQAIVADDIKTNVPVHSVQPTIMYVDKHSNLTRRNPKQMSINDLITVRKDGEAVQVNKETGEVVIVENKDQQ